MASLIFQIMVDSLLLGGVYTLMAVGLSLAFGVTRIINFAHGDVVMYGAYAAFFAFVGLNVDPLLSLVFVAVLGGIGGYLLFKLTLDRILDAAGINQVLLTFGLGLVLQNVAVILWTGDERSTTPSYAFDSWFLSDDVVVAKGRLIAFGLAIAFVVLLLAWLRWSELGRATRAVSQNRAAASLMGINVRAMYGLSFALSTAFGTATGAIMSFLLPITPFMGFPILVKAFAIIILGGLDSIVGTVIGAFFLATAETTIAYVVPQGIGWAEGVAFFLLVMVLIARPNGILGTVGRDA
jgi:branched-chain amino acid transport system permease protein